MKNVCFVLMFIVCGIMHGNVSGEDGWKPTETQIKFLKLNNDYRAKHGLPPQELDEECCRISQVWSERMARTRIFAHGGGENIIVHGGKGMSPESLFRVWINSPSHRAFILSKRKYVGYGYSENSGTSYASGTFH